ncbi:MAG: repeat containing lipoprotein [Fibrobacteres bacterium]|nr:repeat containing lipoprotein [Fibrobacterota bacterium]
MGILILILLVLCGCSRNFDSPYLPDSPDYAGNAWTLDGDGDGVADSVEKYAPGCTQGAETCLALARNQYQVALGKPPSDTGKSDPIPVESITAPDLRLSVGETRPAQVQLLPANATSRNYELSSQNGNVAVVRPGGIYAAGEGSTDIIVHALDGSDKLGRFKVTVVAAVRKITARNLILSVGSGAAAPDLTITPPEAAGADFFLTGGDPVVAVVTADLKHIEPTGPGNTSFKVRLPDNSGVTAVFTVTVKPSTVSVESVRAEDMEFSLINLLDPLRKQPVLTWVPANATDQRYTLVSDNPHIARIVGDSVEAGFTGQTRVTLTTVDGGRTTSFQVTVGLVDLCNGKCKDKEKGKD